MKNILLTTIAFFILIVSCKNKEEIKTETEKTSIRIEQVQSKKMIFPVRSIGKVSLAKEQKLAFKIGGIVRKIHVDESQTVKSGDILASLDLSEITANVTQARKGYEKAQRDFKRVENLYHDSVATLEKFQDIKTALDVAKARVDIAEFNRKHAQITAPTNGIILKQLVEANELVSAGHPVILFGSQKGNKIIRANVPDKDIIKLQIGDSALISFDAYPDQIFKAEITETGEFSDPYTGTFEIEAKLLPTTYKIPSGFIGRVKFYPNEQKEVITIPLIALFNASEMEAYVWTINNGKPVKKKVMINRILENNVVIGNELSPGDTIVTAGNENLSNESDFFIVL